MGKEDRVFLGGFEETSKLFLHLCGWGLVQFGALRIVSAWVRGCSGTAIPWGRNLNHSVFWQL